MVVRGRNPCTDFKAMTPDLCYRLTRMVINEEGEHSASSGHNKIFMEFNGRIENERGGNEGKWFLTQRDIDHIAERLQATPEAGYKHLLGRVEQEVRKQRCRVGKCQKCNVRRWWDWDVGVAMSARKEACRKY